MLHIANDVSRRVDNMQRLTCQGALVWALVAVIALLFCSQRSSAAVQPFPEVVKFDEANPLAGQWLGDIGPADRKSFGQFLFESPKGGWEVTMTLPAHLLVGVTCHDVAATHDQRSLMFSFKLGVNEFTLSGTLDETSQQFTGVMVRGTGADVEDVPFTLYRYPRVKDCKQPMAYKGEIDTTVGVKFELAIVLAQTESGAWVGHLDIPQQNASGFPILDLKPTAESSNTLTGTMPGPPQGTFVLKLSDDRMTLEGSLTQSTVTMPFQFKRDMNYIASGARRPQTPMPPFPYAQRDFEAPHPDGHVLAGTLTIPSAETFGDGPFPAAILITGSGLQDRDETIFGHKMFLVIADYLTRHGIAVARYDDRGVGQSTGRESLVRATTHDFASDTEAVLAWLRTQPEIDPARVGLIGHSEGGTIAPMVAAKPENKIAYIVLLAGTGVPGRDLVLLQNRLMHQAIGVDKDIIDRVIERQTEVLDLILHDGTDDEIYAAVEALLDVPSPMHDDGGDRKGAMRQVIANTKNAWMIEFLRLDPREALAKVRCPVLALNGTKDLQVDAHQNLDEIERVLRNERVDVTAKRCEGLNHLFQPADTGGASEYAEIEITIDESVLREMEAWIKSKMGAQ